MSMVRIHRCFRNLNPISSANLSMKRKKHVKQRLPIHRA